MKVSRKVARRSHRSRYSSVSRRRLRNKKSRSGYKKKHAKTQRGGARSRKYGHKRGKRFHRGGENGFDNCHRDITLRALPRNKEGSVLNNDGKTGEQRRYFTTNTPTIYYTKVGSRFAMEDYSEFTIYVDFITSGDGVDLIIDFTRDPLDNKSPTFLFQTNGTKWEIKKYLDDMPGLLTDKHQTESNQKYSPEKHNILNKNNHSTPLRVYSFGNQKNIGTFKKIADCIKSKIPGVDTAPAAAPAPVAAPAPAAVGTDDEYDTRWFGFPSVPKNVTPPTIYPTETDANEDDPRMAPRISQ